MKKAAYGFAGLIVLLVGAALIVPSFIDWNAYKPEIAAEVRKATGRTLNISGTLEFAVLPTPRLKVTNARLSNAPGATAKHMLALRGLEVSVKLGSLVQGDIEIAGVELIDPLIELEKLADGRMNWELSPVAPRTAPAGPSSGGGSGSSSFKLDLLRIKNGTIVYRDNSAGTVERIEGLTADISAASLAGPFRFDGGLAVRGIPLTLSARVNKFVEKGAIPFSASIGTPGAAFAVDLTGTVTDIETAPTVAAKLDGRGENFGAAVRAISGAPPPPQLSQTFSVSASVKASDTAVSLDRLAFQLGASVANGNANITIQDGTKADVALRMKSLDIDALPSAKGASGPTGSAAKPAADSEISPPPAATGRKFELPADIEANVGLTIDEVIVKKGRIDGVRLAASLKDGEVALNALEAGLPGGGQFSASGAMSAPQGNLAYGGKVSFRSASLRNLLEWMEIDIATVPADRLRRFNVSAGISGDASQVQVANIAGQLDASRMSGGVTVALRARPAFGASFNIDQLNADAYLGESKSTGPDAAGKTPGGPASPDGGVTTPGKSPVAFLKEFDANLALRVGSLSYRQTSIQGVRLDGTLVNGALTLRDASVRSLAGTSARVQGLVTNLEGIPSFKGTIAAASDDVSGLFRVAGIELSIPPRRLGKMRLSSRTDVSDGNLKVDADLQIAEIRAKIAGNAKGFPDTPQFELTLDAKHPELARLANLLSGGKPGPRAGRVGLKLSVKGDEKAVALDANTALAGGVFRVSGNVGTPFETPKLDIAFDLKHPNLVRFVRAFDPGFRPANGKLGGMQVAAKLSGTDSNLTIGDLAGTIGPTGISGSGSFTAGAQRPRINLVLRSSVIPLSDFLKAPHNKGDRIDGASSGGANAATPPATPAQRWSTDPIDAAAFGLVDANIDLRADAILYKTFRVDRPKIIAVLKDRVLDVQRVAGTMFDGGFEMRGQVDARGVPTAATNITITKANVGKALFQAAEFDIATGVLSFGMNLSARGKSQRDMIKALNGNGRINVVNGVVKGFDLKKVSDDLKNINQLTGLLGVLSSAMGGGATRFSSLTGTFGIERGIMRTSDLKLVADAGAGDARGFVDLPKWHMDILADFRLTEHNSAPPFRVRAVGPPDAPRRLFDFQQLQEWILQQGVGGLIKNLIPGAKNKSGSSQQQQPERVKPEDVLKGLLKGLSR